MTRPISLKGMTWSDPRGFDPVVAAANAFGAMHPEVSVSWDNRSLQGFESTPIDELAATYDLMVIDHPHVGAVVRENCLLPIDTHGDPGLLAALASETVGKSYESYHFAGHQWALPIDAAAQVQAVRPDLIGVPVARFDDVLSLAQDGRVIWPLRPPHVLMSFFTLAANLGAPCAVVPGPLTDRGSAIQVFDTMQALFDSVDPACHEMDPIAALDALSDGNRFAMSPLAYLYTAYATDGYRPQRLAFHDIPALGRSGPLGSALGGTGIAISARTSHPKICTEFALWIASAEVQRGIYAANRGQPGNAAAWSDQHLNSATGNAYFQTRMTHEAAWLRPRHAGYMGFQEIGSEILLDAFKGTTSHAAALDALERRFNESFDR